MSVLETSRRLLSHQVRRTGVLVAATAVSAVTSSVALSARGESLDPTLPGRARVGEPRGVSGERHGRRVESALPLDPRVLWRLRARGTGFVGPAVDSSGGIVLASSGRVLQYDVNGSLDFAARLSGDAIVPPVLTSDGTRLVLTSDGVLTAMTPRGDVRYRRRFGERAAPRVLVADRDGGALIGTTSAVLRVDRSGALLASARIPSGVLEILRRRESVWVVGQNGDVSEWLPTAELRRVGTLGGKPSRAALSGGRVLGVVEHSRVVELDLSSTDHRVRFVDLARALDGGLALGPRGTMVTTLDDQLLAHDALGRELARVPLVASRPVPDAGLSSNDGAALDPVADPAGAIAVARPGRDLALVEPDGDVRFAVGVACADPVGLAAVPGRRLVLVCRSGSVWMLGDRSGERTQTTLPPPDDGPRNETAPQRSHP